MGSGAVGTQSDCLVGIGQRRFELVLYHVDYCAQGIGKPGVRIGGNCPVEFRACLVDPAGREVGRCLAQRRRNIGRLLATSGEHGRVKQRPLRRIAWLHHGARLRCLAFAGAGRFAAGNRNASLVVGGNNSAFENGYFRLLIGNPEDKLRALDGTIEIRRVDG